MKNLIFGIFATILLTCNLTFSQSKLTDEEMKMITNFINSPDYTSNNFLSSKKFDTSKAKISYSEDGFKTPNIYLPLFNKSNMLIGSLEIVKKETLKLKLPNEGGYFIMYRDFTNFDFTSLSGKIAMYDNNYDNYLFNTINYSKGKSTSYLFVNCPTEILEKYDSIITYNHNVLERNKYNGLCDTNHNGNLSFSECYSCFNGSCASNPECFTLCYGIADTLGWVSPAPGIPMCQASIGVACVYLAAVY
jgi:hypothetical protein